MLCLWWNKGEKDRKSLWWNEGKKDRKTTWHIILTDNHRYKRREHSEDQFSAPKTIYFILLSSLVAFPAICHQLLSAKDTQLASKRNDKGYPAPNLWSWGLALKLKDLHIPKEGQKLMRPFFKWSIFCILQSKWLACEDVCRCLTHLLSS